MTLTLPHPADDRPEVIAGEVVHHDVLPAGLLEELPAGGAAALARVPRIALDPFARLVDAFLDEGVEEDRYRIERLAPELGVLEGWWSVPLG